MNTVIITTLQLPLELTNETEQLILHRSNNIKNAINSAIHMNYKKDTNRISLIYKLYSKLRSLYPELSSLDIHNCITEAARKQKIHNTQIRNLEAKLQWLQVNKPSRRVERLQKSIHKLKAAPFTVRHITTLPIVSRHIRLDITQSTMHIYGFTKREFISIPIKLNKYTIQKLSSASIGDCKLCKHKNNKWYAHITIKHLDTSCIDVNSPIMGVDIGIKNLATTNEGEMYDGSLVWKHCEKLERQRSKLQAKGTRSAKRKLRKTSGRKSRYLNDILHRVSRWVVEQAKTLGAKCLIIENITLIPQIIGNPFLRKAVQRWPFSKLLHYIYYKAKLAGIYVYTQFSAHTSDTCSQCGYQHKKNRIKQNTFTCLKCKYTNHADINAAINLRNCGYKWMLSQSFHIATA